MTTSNVYGLASTDLVLGNWNWITSNIYFVLCSSAYTPNVDTDQYASSLIGEISGGGYTRQLLPNRTAVYDSTNNGTVLSSDLVQFISITGTFRYAIAIKNTGSDASSNLLFWIDYGADQVYAAQTLTIPTPSPGWIMVQV